MPSQVTLQGWRIQAHGGEDNVKMEQTDAAISQGTVLDPGSWNRQGSRFFPRVSGGSSALSTF